MLRCFLTLLMLLAAAPAMADAPSCESDPAAATSPNAFSLTLLRPDLQPLSDMLWQPPGGSVPFTLARGTGGFDGLRVMVCYRLTGYSKYVASPSVSPAAPPANGSATYHATVPANLEGAALPNQKDAPDTAARTSLVARLAEMRVIVTDASNTVLFVGNQNIGITSVWLSALLALVATVAAFFFIFWVSAQLNVPGRGFLKIISTRWGVASLSQLQVVLWTFVVGASAVYVMAISGGLIDISNGTLILLGIAGVSTAASKLQSSQDSGKPGGNGATPKTPPAKVDLAPPSAVTESELVLAWNVPIAGAPARSYLVQFRLAPIPAAVPPRPAGDWLSLAETVLVPRCRVMNLDAGEHYEFQVIPRNEFGDGPPSNVMPQATDAAAVVQGAPARVAGLRLAAAPKVDEVSLAWTAIANADYIVQFRPHDADSDWQPSRIEAGATYTLSGGIDHATRYDVRVAARLGNVPGPWSRVLTVHTLRRPQWADLVVKQAGTSEIDVTRVQMLFFTVISALFVAMKVVSSYTIPVIPDGFLLLMGISNGIYLTYKFVPD
jgi:hypothetical protein